MARPIIIPDEHIRGIQSIMALVEGEGPLSTPFSSLSDHEIASILESSAKIYKSRGRKFTRDVHSRVTRFYNEQPDDFLGSSEPERLRLEVHRTLGIPRKEDISDIVRFHYPDAGSHCSEGDALRKSLEDACKKFRTSECERIWDVDENADLEELM